MTVHQFFIHINKTKNDRSQTIKELFLEYQNKSNLEPRAVRRIISLILMESRTTNLLSREIVDPWIQSKMNILQDSGELYTKYIDAWMSENQVLLQEVREELCSLEMKYG